MSEVVIFNGPPAHECLRDRLDAVMGQEPSERMLADLGCAEQNAPRNQFSSKYRADYTLRCRRLGCTVSLHVSETEVDFPGVAYGTRPESVEQILLEDSTRCKLILAQQVAVEAVTEAPAMPEQHNPTLD